MPATAADVYNESHQTSDARLGPIQEELYRIGLLNCRLAIEFALNFKGKLIDERTRSPREGGET